MKYFYIFFCAIFLTLGCAGSKNNIDYRNAKSHFSKPFYENQFTGLLLINAQTKDTLINYNATKYFTPASNTKIFTFYTANSLLGKKTPMIRYLKRNDTLYFEGLGDPSSLHPYFKDQKLIHFLKSYKNVVYCYGNFHEQAFAPGWAWEDFDQYYSPERNSLPLYGNVHTLYNDKNQKSYPSYFSDKTVIKDSVFNRALHKNVFYKGKKNKDSLEIPFITNQQTTKALLSDFLKKNISIQKRFPKGKSDIKYSIPTDSLYKRLLHQSDNFIAEQLMLLSSSTLSDSLYFSKARDYILKNQLKNIPQVPRWVDGSGLSRYNLFTPESIVFVLTKLLSEIPKERLFKLFPAGGKNGTLKNYYKSDNAPYIFAKSGSVGNNYNLSGYLITKKKQTLIFSYMNNHYRTATVDVKKEMTQLFEAIKEAY